MDEESEGVAPIPDRGEVRVGPRFDVSRKARRREGDSRRRVARARWLCAPDSAAGEVGGSEGCTTIERTLFFLYRNHVDVTSTPTSKRTNPETTVCFALPSHPFFFRSATSSLSSFSRTTVLGKKKRTHNRERHRTTRLSARGEKTCASAEPPETRRGLLLCRRGHLGSRASVSSSEAPPGNDAVAPHRSFLRAPPGRALPPRMATARARSRRRPRRRSPAASSPAPASRAARASRGRLAADAPSPPTTRAGLDRRRVRAPPITPRRARRTRRGCS